ncbi:MAG: carboxynorspermidine decarboxylase [Desulfobacterales bacterium]|nr:carboxynorspermidine decarboxylase [Desulfobacterales bacterium]MBF0398216.1 carboxynorspermidine decarboxylase [Desulfobacterales bacterium]
MERNYPVKLNLDLVKTPAFIVDESLIKRNLEILDLVQKRTGAKILLALKGFAMFSLFSQIKETLHGVCASSPHEARLGYEEFGREIHAFAPAYSEIDIKDLSYYCDHIIFNSFPQWKRFKNLIYELKPKMECGIRINPEYSEIKVKLYDPCAPNSRLGVRLNSFEEEYLEGISGIHFHTMCEQNADTLMRILEIVENKFGKYLHKMKWVNFGGGNHITKSDYNINLLCEIILKFRDKYNVQVYLEPGEAVALNTGILVASVLDIINDNIKIAILDTSAANHMPDVLEMPYRPKIVGAGDAYEKAYTYRLGGLTCLAGDVIGDYSFDEPLAIGSKIIFLDMAHYSMVKTNTFNGIKLPSICIYDPYKDELKVIREFGYEDFKGRLS